MLSLILAAATAALVSPTPQQYYSQALATMQALPEPAYVAFDTTVAARGWGIAEPCEQGKILWSFGFGGKMQRQLTWHAVYGSRNADETIRTVTGDTCHGPAETFDRPTWQDAYAWVRYGFSQPPKAEIRTGASHTTQTSLKTIADVSVISPGAYRITDGGAQRCPSGSPGHALHFAPRFDPMTHLLRDAVVETNSMRICMVRLDLDTYQAAGTGYRGDLRLDFGEVDGNWIITRGHAVFAVRMAGISLKTAALDFWYANVVFPATAQGV
ncbi:MAG TPA: hypothetical protein VKT72_07180 [Candidatus Baltobacteraceae bacterium]|nr:hypothetical protein [Candidatus Baltobacteraceae bacterium]